MKKNILYILLCSIFAWQSAYAQTSSGSRLNMTAKKKTASAETMKNIGVPAILSYKPLSLKNKTTVSNFYKTFLFPATVSQESTFVLTSEIDDRSIERLKPSMETVAHADEQLYSSALITISNIYPNPANDQAELDYTMSSSVRDARLIIYNVLGSQMNEIPLSRTEKKIRVDTREMPTGLYFYQLSVDGRKVATKKMLVRHQQ
jgi:hypothetical protein